MNFKAGLLIIFCFVFVSLPAQQLAISPFACSGIITVYPYTENFEAGDGNWNSGGIASDWEWGAVAKPVIDAAASGSNCWATGGLTNSRYNDSEGSWLESPCFDLSSLQYPQISFKLWWETERRFDGASLTYSIDGGNTWTTLGGVNSVVNCEGENWYNQQPITYLGNSSGWSGNIQSGTQTCLGGNGSGGWLTAKHTLSMLNGQANVRFRFLFASGSICNDFDGFAIDDIFIGEAPQNIASINTACVNNHQVSFSSDAKCASSLKWNFGDPASGNNNLSASATPAHNYIAPGIYTVTLTAEFFTGAPVTTTREVVVIEPIPVLDWPGYCTNTPNAKLSVSGTGSNTPYTYLWNTVPPQTTPSISNVGIGNYTVTINSLNACSASAIFSLTPPVPIKITTTVTNASCSASNGSIATSVTGGEGVYTYQWSNGSTASAAENLAPGNYSVLVKDLRGCIANSGNIPILNVQKTLTAHLGPDISLCPGQSVILSAGNFSSYEWQDHSTSSTFKAMSPGKYFVTVKDAAGCSGSDTVNIKIDCSDIYFPSAFTPGNDNRNNDFGPLGSNLASLKDYRLTIYNRYGQRIFISTDPFKHWDGRDKGVLADGVSFVWMAEYSFNGAKLFRKGFITILR